MVLNSLQTIARDYRIAGAASVANEIKTAHCKINVYFLIIIIRMTINF